MGGNDNGKRLRFPETNYVQMRRGCIYVQQIDGGEGEVKKHTSTSTSSSPCPWPIPSQVPRSLCQMEPRRILSRDLGSELTVSCGPRRPVRFHPCETKSQSLDLDLFFSIFLFPNKSSPTPHPDPLRRNQRHGRPEIPQVRGRAPGGVHPASRKGRVHSFVSVDASASPSDTRSSVLPAYALSLTFDLRAGFPGTSGMPPRHQRPSTCRGISV
jgi:hypothetical protein